MRHFTVDEANALLPMLTPTLEDLQRLGQRMQEAVEAVRAFEHKAARNGHSAKVAPFEPQHDLAEIRAEMEKRLQYLYELGVHLKDIENGILDFPTRMHGQDVYLCWHLGEERVAYWHEIEAGFAGRRPLPF